MADRISKLHQEVKSHLELANDFYGVFWSFTVQSCQFLV